MRKKARKVNKLDQLIGYLQKHRAYIPNYRQRRAQCRFNSINPAERACSVLVARRQKHKSMHWVTQGRGPLCALQTLWHNWHQPPLGFCMLRKVSGSGRL